MRIFFKIFFKNYAIFVMLTQISFFEMYEMKHDIFKFLVQKKKEKQKKIYQQKYILDFSTFFPCSLVG